MKDYDRLILWIDYFNSEFSRSQGRRVRTDSAIKSPTLNELVEACANNNYSCENHIAYYPKRMNNASGYISLEKKDPKSLVIKKLAKSLMVIRPRGIGKN